MQFSHPFRLLFLLFLPVIFWLFWRRVPEGPLLPVWVRMTVFLLLTLAAGGLEIRAGRPGRSVVFLLDRSQSVGEEGLTGGLSWTNRAISSLASEDRAGVVVFAGEAVVERPLGPKRPLSGLRSVPDTEATDLAGALRLATEMLSSHPQGEVVLVSDGNPTTADALREAGVAAARGIHVDVFPVGEVRAPGEVEVTAVTAPEQVRIGEPFEIEVTVVGHRGSEVILRHYRETLEAERREILPRDGPHHFRFASRLKTPGLNDFTVTVESPGDRWLHNNGGGVVVLVAGRPRVLFLRGAAEQGVLERLLTRSDFVVDVVSPPSMPPTAEELSTYDLVVLDDLPATAYGDEFAASLAHYVTDRGGGLILIGAGGGFDPDGWSASPVAEILPVEMHPGRRETPGVALVLVLDKSGSMAADAGGLSKLEAAKGAAVSLLEVLSPEDSLGIVAFDREAISVIGPRQGADPRAVRQLFAGIEAGGGTELGPALERAYRWLGSAAGPSRHVLLLSDGRVGEEDLNEIRQRIADAGIVLSAVGVGSNVDRHFLSRLAESTGGRVYFPDTLDELPDVFRREGRRIAGQRLVERRLRPRVEESHEILRGLEGTTFPEMGGHVAVTAREGASVPLVSDRRGPILACWRFGLGRTLTFASNLGSGWTAGWLDWQSFAKLWLQMVRWTARPLASERMKVRLEAVGDRGLIVVDVYGHDGRWLNFLDLRAQVRFPDGSGTEIPLVQTSSGRYEGEMALAGRGLHLVEVTATGEGLGGEETVLTGLHVSALAEQRSLGPNRALLEAITQRTGGMVLSAGELPRWRQPPGTAWRRAWHLPATAALVLFFVDVALRRRWVG